MIKYAVGFVDEDPREIRRYRKRFKDEGIHIIDYELAKGLEIDRLVDRIYESDIDLVMVDFLLNEKGTLGFNGDEVVRKFEKLKPGFPKIIFTSKQIQAFPKVDDVNLIYDKANILGNSEQLKWFIAILTKNIEKYKNDIKQREDRIEELITKRENKKEGINEMERAELYKLSFELNNLDQKTKMTPDNLLVDLKLDKLHTSLKEAKKLLDQLRKGEFDAEDRI